MKKAIFGKITKTAVVLIAVMIVTLMCAYGAILLGDNKTVAASDGNVTNLSPTVTEVADGSKVVTITGVSIADKVYDGTTVIDKDTVDITNAFIVGLDDGDRDKLGLEVVSATAGSSDVIDPFHAATTTIVYKLTNKDAEPIAEKYTVADSTDVKYFLKKRVLGATDVVLKERKYDGSLRVSLDNSFALDATNVVAGDDVTLESAVAIMNDKNAGDAKTINRVDVVLKGAKAANYRVELSQAQKEQTVKITKRPLKVDINYLKVGETDNAGRGVAVYNGSNKITLTRSNFVRAISEGLVTAEGTWIKGDEVRAYEAGTTATVTDKNVGEDKEITIAAIFEGRDKDNYEAYTEGNLYVNIIKSNAVSIGGVEVDAKIYDKTNKVTVKGGQLRNVFSADIASLGFELNPNATIADAGVGTNKKVTYSAVLTGAASGNYNLSVDPVSVTVKPKVLTANWAKTEFTYSGALHNTGVTLVGILGDDVVIPTVNYTSVPNKRAGIDVIEGGSSAVIVLDNANYIINDKTAKIKINPRVIEVVWSGNVGLIFDGANKYLTATISNLVDGDVAELVIGGNGNKEAGYYQASIVDVKNANYAKPADTIVCEYTILANTLANKAATAYRLNFQLIKGQGVDPHIEFHAVNVASNLTKAPYKASRDEKVFASYRLFTKLGEVESTLEGKQILKLQLQDDWAKAKVVKMAVYDGTSIVMVNAVVEKGIATFELTNALEITLVIEYGNITSLLVIGLIVAGILLLIAIILLLIYRFNNRKLLFDPSGGEPVEGMAGKFKQEIALPSTERKGCQLDGWYKAKNYKKKAEYAALPFWDTVVVARWKNEDGDMLAYERGSIVLPAGRPIMAKVELSNSIAEQNAVTTRTISFETRGGDKIMPITDVMGKSVKIPMPSGSDAFAGWYYDEEFTREASIKKMPKEDTLIYAKWAKDRVIKEVTPLTVKMDKSDKIRTVTFESRGGSVVEPITAVKKSKINVPAPTKGNDTFAYWSITAEKPKKFDLSSVPTLDTTVYAIWSSDLNPVGKNITDEAKRNKTLNADFEKNVGSSAQAGVPGNVSSKIDELMFGKATMSSRPLVDQAKKDTQAATPIVNVVPRSTPQPVVQQPLQEVNLSDKNAAKALLFNTRGGHPIRPLQAKIGTPIDLPVPTKGESKFMGWYKDEGLTRPVDFSKMPMKNTMLFAKWIEDGTIQEVYDEGLVDVAEQKASKADFDAKQKTIDTMMKGDDRPIDDIVIMRSGNAKKSMLIDDSKK